MIARARARWRERTDWSASFWRFCLGFYLLPWFAWKYTAVRRGTRAKVHFAQRVWTISANCLMLSMLVGWFVLAMLTIVDPFLSLIIFLFVPAHVGVMILRAQGARIYYAPLNEKLGTQ